MQAGLAIWDVVWGDQIFLPYIIDLLGPFREIWEYAREFSGEKMCQSVGILVEFTLVQSGFDLGASILESLGLHGSPKMESPGGNVESQTWGS